MKPYDNEDDDWGESFDDLGPEYWEDYLGGPEFDNEDACCRDEDDEFCEYECDSAEDDEGPADADENDYGNEQDYKIDYEDIEK